MSQTSGVDVSYNFEPDTPRLLPAGSLKAKLTMRFSADGVLDFDDLLDQLLACVEQKMGKIKQISQAGRENLKTQIARHVVATSVHTVSDVLNAFHDDGEPYRDSDEQLHVPLCMQVSGRKLDLAPTLDASGELDCEALVESFESAYRGVFQNVRLDSVQILTPAQRDTINEKASEWLAGKCDLVSIEKIIEPYDFELQNDGKCWIRSGSLSFCLVNSETGYKGDALDVAVPTQKTREEMCKKIASELCDTLREHLKTSSKSNNNFNQVFKYKYKGWKDKAKEWLDDDIRAEEDWGECFEWKPWYGKAVRAELKTNKNDKYGDYINYFDLLFDNNGCYNIEEKREQITPWMHNLVGGKGILDETKLKQIEPPLAEAMIEAIRDTSFSHPYKPETIKKVFELRAELGKAADIFELSKLALAGAYAEILERDSAVKVHELHDFAMNKVGKNVGDFYNKFPEELTIIKDEMLSLGVSFAGRTLIFAALGVTVGVTIPATVVTLALTNAIWNCIPKPNREEIVKVAAQTVYFFKDLPDRIIQSNKADNEDNRLRIKTKADLEELKGASEMRARWSQEMVKAINGMSQDEKDRLYIYYRMDKDSELINRARQIEKTLGDLSQTHRQRKMVYKVERFYTHFNA